MLDGCAVDGANVTGQGSLLPCLDDDDKDDEDDEDDDGDDIFWGWTT